MRAPSGSPRRSRRLGTADFEWSTDDDAPDGEIHAAVVLADGTSVWPMRRVMQRYSNGPEDGIYEYGLVVTQ